MIKQRNWFWRKNRQPNWDERPRKTRVFPSNRGCL